MDIEFQPLRMHRCIVMVKDMAHNQKAKDWVLGCSLFLRWHGWAISRGMNYKKDDYLISEFFNNEPVTMRKVTVYAFGLVSQTLIGLFRKSTYNYLTKVDPR